VKLVIGLGNPGSQYAETRHNIGWMVLDRLADRAGKGGRGRQRDASESVQIRYKGLDLVLAKPLTFMNDSGVAVRKLLARERVPMAEVLVIADDFALPFGKLRFREAGSHGGHNGLRSIIEELESEKFSRLRVGIGEPGRGAIDHVLSRFAADERTRLPILLDAAADAVEAWARDGTSKAANRFNAFELQGPVVPDGTEAPKPGEVGGPPATRAKARTRLSPARTAVATRAPGGDRPVPRADDARAEARRQGRARVGRATRGGGGGRAAG
jgi:PTH1 family peptidyl-tRNA hydrolase